MINAQCSDLTIKNGAIGDLSGQSLTVNATIAQDAAATCSAGSFKIGIYLSTDDILDDSDKLVYEQDVSSGLATNEEKSINTTIDLSNKEIPAGNYIVIAKADIEGTVEEITETNNRILFGPFNYNGSLNVGIFEITREQISVKAFPKPATDHINLQFETSNNMQMINVLDITGRILQTQRRKQNQERIDLSSIPNGLVLIEVTENSKTIWADKFVKQ